MTGNTCNGWQQSNRRICSSFLIGWQLILLRVKGGTDYFLVGEFNVQTLRRFQSSYRSPAQPFKQVPVTFEVVFGRKVLAAGENNE